MTKLAQVGLLSALLWLSGCVSTNELAEFTSDGCSLFPDGTLQDHRLWCDCCFAHDLAYWRGGSAAQRDQADMTLRACVLKRTANPALAEIMYEGVRFGGSPVFPSWYRWGYGWNYGRGYQPLTDREQEQADQRLSGYFTAHPSGYCSKPTEDGPQRFTASRATARAGDDAQRQDRPERAQGRFGQRDR